MKKMRQLLTKSSLVTQLVKNPPAMQETPGEFLGWEDPLEKGQATHSSILAWRIHRVEHEWATYTFTFNCTRKEM